MKVRLDGTVCQGHARCWEIDEDLFPADDNGYALPIADRSIDPAHEETVRRAVRACPERAITLLD